MSIRTAIEINHDFLDVLEDPEAMRWLKMYLSSAEAYKIDGMRQPYGIRYLAQRHHSEPEFTVTVTIRSSKATGGQ